MISSNYQRVIDIIEQLPKKNLTIENMYQRACLNQALLDFKDRQYNKSILNLNKTINQKIIFPFLAECLRKKDRFRPYK